MTKLLSDDQVRAACAKTLAGPGHHVVEAIRNDVAAQHPDTLIRVKASSAAQLVVEFDMLREAAARLAGEARAFRNNLQLERDAPPPRLRSCINCVFFDAVKATDAHVSVERQAIVQEAGVCRRNPPVGLPLRTMPGSVTMSYFPPVLPDQWCGCWQIIDNRKVPIE